MKNTECTIYITTKRGYTQIYRKDNGSWTQTNPNGVVRRMTAEQLLSHLLSPLAAGKKSKCTIKIKKVKTKKSSQNIRKSKD